MTPQYSQPTRLSDYIAFLLPWAHGHQRKAIGDFVAAIIEQQTACQAQLARYFGKQEAAVKRLSRLLHNERLDPRLLADAVLLGNSQEIMYHFSHPAVECGRNTWGGIHDVRDAPRSFEKPF